MQRQDWVSRLTANTLIAIEWFFLQETKILLANCHCIDNFQTVGLNTDEVEPTLQRSPHVCT
jgi:hypothetical protein